MHEVNKFNVFELIPLIRNRELSVSTLIEAYIQRINQVNPLINALVQYDVIKLQEAAYFADKQLKQSKFSPKPFFGIPFTAKDIYSVPNYIVSFGTKGLSHQACHQRTTVVDRISEQGGLLLGLTNTPEMGVSLETDNLVYGRTNHPLNLDYSCGGSSGGEAALISSYASPLGIAGDHGGGARYPAHCCGVFTLRPSLGRLPQTGTIIPKRGWVALTSRISPMARCVEDLEIALNVMQGGDGFDPHAERPIPKKNESDHRKLRIFNLVDSTFDGFDIAIPQAIESVCKHLSVNHLVKTIPFAFEEGFSIAKLLFQADAGHGLSGLLTSLNTTDYSVQLQAWLNELPREALTLDQYLALWARWDEYKIKFIQLFKLADVILCPVAPQCALPHGSTIQSDAVWSLIRYTASMSLTECPVVVAPCGYNKNRFPIGVQVVTKPWKDELALAVAKEISMMSVQLI